MGNKMGTIHAIKNINLWQNLRMNYEDVVNNFYKSYSALTNAANTAFKFYKGEIKHDSFLDTAKEALSIPLDLVKCLLFFSIGAIKAIDSVNLAVEDIKLMLAKSTQALLEGNHLFSSPEYLQHKINDITGIKLKTEFATDLTNTYNATNDIATSLKNIGNIVGSADIDYKSGIDILKNTASLIGSAVSLTENYSDIDYLCTEGISTCLSRFVDDTSN